MQISSHRPAPKRDWTVLYVLNGDNDLREAATLDLVSLDKTRAPESAHVAAQLYRGELKWNMRNLSKKVGNLFKPTPPPTVNTDWRGAKVFEVRTQGTTEETTEASCQGSTKPSDPKSLEAFVAWGMKQYPAENYAVVLSGHGGPDGLLSDSDGKKMNFGDISQALKTASAVAGEELDVVLFDSCATASDETAKAMNGAAKFLVAQEKNTQNLVI